MQATVDLNLAEKLAIFLRDYGVYATEALLILALVYLFRIYRQSEADKFELAMSVAPLTEALMEMLEHVGSQARIRSYNSKPPPKSGEEGTDHG